MIQNGNFDFLIRKDRTADLQQGDIIVRSDEVRNSIGEAHQYYAKTGDYSHFLVISQSCDLIKYNGFPKADYISICAVRPFSRFSEKVVAPFSESSDGFPLLSLRVDSRQKIIQKIEQLVHFDLSNYFFLPAKSAPTVDIPSVAFLQLSVALKRSHYDVLLRSRVGQLTEIFSAKLGWLTGNIYSRVATPDFESEWGSAETKSLIDDLILEHIDSQAVWLGKNQTKEFKRRVNDWNAANPSQIMTLPEAGKLIDSLPTHEESFADIAAQLARQAGLQLKPDVEESLKGIARSSPRVRAFIKRLQSGS